MTAPATPSIHAEPMLHAWADVAMAAADRPRILVGHQPGFWHPGVLAKYFAAHALAEAVGGSVTHLVADQDTGDPLVVQKPVLKDPEDPWSLRVEEVRLGPPPNPTMPLCVAEPIVATDEGDTWGMGEAISVAKSSGSLAEQLTNANTSMLGSLVPNAATHFASRIARTPEFGDLIDRMYDEPAGAHESYNRAVHAHTDARVRTLDRSRERGLELPLWGVDARGRRVPLYEHDDRPEMILPRGIMLSAFTRARLCDISIVGRGGARYEPVAEAWFDDWLGESLAPVLVISADVRLDLVPELVTPESVAHAAWVAHRAHHDPGLVGDDDRARQKTALLEHMSQTVDRDERARLYRSMHALLDDYRDARAEQLTRLADRADSDRARLAGSRVAAKRDWAWPFYPRERLEELRDRIRSGVSRQTA